MRRRTDPNKVYYGPPAAPYQDPERVPMLILLLGLMIGLVVFLVWALG